MRMLHEGIEPSCQTYKIQSERPLDGAEKGCFQLRKMFYVEPIQKVSVYNSPGQE
jgi:hypothetical protein